MAGQDAVDGTPFGRYRLVELLGRGGMGEVWRAHDTVIDRTVAIKTLLPHFAQDKTFEQRFRREARAAARLDDPHVVPIYDVGELEGRLYVTMRLIKGRDLQALIDDGPLEPKRAVRLIEQVAAALDAAHHVGLVHRDVKPSNILITNNDFAYLIDFGIARAAGEAGLTSTGLTVGTWSYMAPERFREGEVEPSSDIYALACVLYQCLTGQLPFPGTTFEQVAMAHMVSPPPKPSTQRWGIPAAMDDVIATGLAKHPDRRYKTAPQLAAAARSAVTEPASTDSTESTPLDVEFEVRDVEKKRRRKNPFESLNNRLGVPKVIAVMAITVAAFVVVVLAIVIVIPRGKQEPPGSKPQITSQTPSSTSESVETAPSPPPAPAPPAPSTAPAPTSSLSHATVPPTAPPEPSAGRIDNVPGGFSFVLPAGWVESDPSHLQYGSVLLSKATGQPPLPGQPTPVADDTRVLLGRLDQTLYASAEVDNARAAVRLGSDMGEYFMPYPGMRINQERTSLTGVNGMTGSASYYEVTFRDTTKPNGQLWAGVVGSPNGAGASPPQRWWLLWLGTSNDPVDRPAATMLAESLRPWPR